MYYKLMAVFFISTIYLSGASFDCRKAQTKIEKTICSNSQLSQLDSQLGETYTQLTSSLSTIEVNKLKKDQREWIKKRNLCNNIVCLKEQYQNRVAILKSMPSNNIKMNNISKKNSNPISNTYTFTPSKLNSESLAQDRKDEKPLSNTFTFSKHTTAKTTDSKVVPPTKTVVATGYGTTKEKALKNAFKSAVQQYVGVLVDADTVVKNNKLIKDEILTASNGYIESYDEVSTENDDGLMAVKIKAVVRSQKVFGKVKSLNIATVNIDDTQDIYARIASKEIAKRDAVKIFKRAYTQFTSKESLKELLSLGITDVKIHEESVRGDKVPITIKYEMRINKKVYAQKIEQLEQSFRNLGIELKKKVDLPYISHINNKTKLNITNKKNIKKFGRTDLGIIKYYGSGYKLDVWHFLPSWYDIYPFSSERASIKWNEYFNIFLEIKKKNGEVLLADDLTENKSGYRNYFAVLTGLIDHYSGYYYYKGYYIINSDSYVKVIFPFFMNKRGDRFLEKISYTKTIYIVLKDIKDLGSINIELSEI
jgi:uncharacterized protein